MHCAIQLGNAVVIAYCAVEGFLVGPASTSRSSRSPALGQHGPVVVPPRSRSQEDTGRAETHLIRARNSALVLSERRNAPSMADVMVVAPGFCTPRMVMH